MPYFGEYILKLSVSLGIICLFYQLALRGLTFYNWNRFYLLAYTLLCFFIPLINISEVAQSSNMTVYKTFELIPSIMPQGVVASSAATEVNKTGWPAADILLVIFLTGVTIMTVRLIIQLISLRRLIRKAALVSDEKVKLYQVNSRIIPFAFGRSVFINRHLHEAKDMEEIIRHEFVHIRQKHSIDIIWAELLCIFNWYNPFVWWIRNSIRQNLEYLADDKVLRDGIDKKQYQYLLLKVMGDHRFTVTSPLNFSSLKKRITMMNKMKSTGIHLLKFLFIAPLMVVMMMAFRKDNNMPANKNSLSLSGIIFDKATELPVSGAVVKDSATGVQTISDKNGFYTLTIPVKNISPVYIRVDYQKQGYPLTVPLKCTFGTQKSLPENMIVITGLVNERDISRHIKPSLLSVSSSQPGSNTYTYASKRFEDYVFQQQTGKLVQHSTKPVWIIDGIPYVFMEYGSAWFDKEEVISSPECKVWFDGKIMSIGEANNTINRLELKNVGAIPKARAKEILGVDCNVLMLAKDSAIPRGPGPSVLQN